MLKAIMITAVVTAAATATIIGGLKSEPAGAMTDFVVPAGSTDSKRYEIFSAVGRAGTFLVDTQGGRVWQMFNGANGAVFQGTPIVDTFGPPEYHLSIPAPTPPAARQIFPSGTSPNSGSNP